MRLASLMFCLAILHGCISKNAESETFLIPEGLTGNIIIYYNDSTGEKKSYLDKRRIYKIPKTQILKTQFGINDGWLDQQFYYIFENGNKKEILLDSTKLYYNDPESANRFKKNHMNDTLIMAWGIGGRKGNKEYQQFVIGTYQNPYSIDTLFTQ